jgi:hypothetical protein
LVNAATPGRQGAVSLNGWVFRKWTHSPNGAVADSLDEAKAAFGGARAHVKITEAGRRALSRRSH